MSAVGTAQPAPPTGMGFREFVVLIAAIMATNALAIDTMLPALPQIGEDLGISVGNQRQWIVTAYLLGFGSAQIIYGSLADRYGRRPVLLVSMFLYAIAGAAAIFAGSLTMMVVARVIQGIGAAGTRVLAVSIVRDCYSGRQMARVMSLTFIVFLAVPVAAPTLGQAILFVAPWRAIFLVLAAFGTFVGVWVAWRLPETLAPSARLSISPSRIAAAFREALSQRIAVGYMLAMTLVLGSLFAYINSVQQLFDEVFGAPQWMPAMFGATALCMALSSMLNAKIVERIGMRRVSHAALLGFILVAIVHAVVVAFGAESLILFSVFQAAMMFCFGLVVSNFGAMAMEPLGHIAGTASSVQGFVTTLGAALLGFAIGQFFDGTALPLTLGFVLLGLGAVAIVLVTERGRLFAGGKPAAH